MESRFVYVLIVREEVDDSMTLPNLGGMDCTKGGSLLLSRGLMGSKKLMEILFCNYEGLLYSNVEGP